MGPLPLIAAAFVLGVCSARGGDAVPLALLACGLLLAGIAGRGRRWRGVSTIALMGCALVVGLVRGLEVPSAVPRARATVEAGLVRGRVVIGCDGAPGERVRCVVARDEDGAEVVLRAWRCDARPGDRVEAVATVRTLAPDANGSRLGPGGVMFRRGIAFTAIAEACDRSDGRPGVLDRARRAGLWTRALLGRGLSRGLDAGAEREARALLFGDEAGLDEGALEAFRETGLAHLLAVSGAHVALLAALLGGLAGALAKRIRALASRGVASAIGALVPLPALALFVLATGESASAVRALVSSVLGALALASGRRAEPASVVAASALVTLCVAPALALDAGWQLSLSAAWALALRPRDVGQPRVAAVPTLVRSLVGIAGEGLGASARVAVATAPVLAWHFQRVPLTALVANALAAPLAEALLLPSVLAVGLAGALSAPLARVAGALVAPVLASLFALPGLARSLPLASVTVPPPTPAEAVVLLAAASAALASARTRIRAVALTCGLALVAPVELLHQHDAAPRGVLRVTAIDVGQGDAVLVDLPDGEAMLVDAGGGSPGSPDPGARVVVPLLADLRRRRLAVVVASHPHPDHVGGLAAVLRWATVGELWDTRQGQGAPSGPWLAMRREADRAGVRVIGPEALCGPPRPFHGASIEVLAPCPGVEPGDRPNDASFVIRVAYGRGSVLLAGDLEARGEARALARIRAPVTVLKVAHHGSHTSSTPAFLDALRPRVALISAGHPSPFDHPSLEVLERLRAIGAQVLDTSTMGGVSVTIRSDGSTEGAALGGR